MRKPQKRVDTKIIPNGVSLGKGQISDESAGKVDGESEVSSEGGRDVTPPMGSILQSFQFIVFEKRF